MKTTRSQRIWSIGAAVGLSIGLLTACGSSGSSDASASSAEATTEVAPATSGGVLNANTATKDEMKTSFEAAGVPNADTWADEIAEYRPFDSLDAVHEKLKEYDISDQTWAELSKLITVS